VTASSENYSQAALYVRRLADMVGLCDWRFVVLEEAPADTDAVANVTPVAGRKYAEFRFRPDFFDDGPEERRATVLHELIHCHLAAISEQVRSDLLTHLGQATYDVFVAAFLRQLEYAVDGMAEAWAELLPLPGDPAVSLVS
jgi:hypothetical protein